jgi:hypothetical protein
VLVINASVPSAPAGLVELPTNAPWLGDNAAGQASIDAYLAAGDRMATLMGVVWRACLGLFVLVGLAWGLGLLPGAVKPL